MADSERKPTPGKVKLNNARLSFSKNLFVAGTFQDGEGEAKFSSSFILYKDDPFGKKNIAACDDAIDEVIREYEAKSRKRFPPLADLDKKNISFYDGENSRGEPFYEGWENSMIVAARNSRRPLVINRDKSVLVAEDGILYPGCYVNAVVRFWVQDNRWGKALRCSLESVQFVKDGDAFGPERATDEDYDNLDEDEGRSSQARDDRRSSRDDRRDRGRDDDRRDRGRDDDRRSSRDRDSRDRDFERSEGRGRDDRRSSRRDDDDGSDMI